MVNLIVHGLIVQDEKVLLIKRSKIRRGKQNYNPERWDVPGGSVEISETPRNAVVREILEETNCIAVVEDVVYDMYQYDSSKDKEFLTLVYKMKTVECSNIKLNQEEHTEYKWVSVKDLLNTNLDLDILEYIIPSLRRLI